jgi:uncharacterized membrane-anchored protein
MAQDSKINRKSQNKSSAVGSNNLAISEVAVDAALDSLPRAGERPRANKHKLLGDPARMWLKVMRRTEKRFVCQDDDHQ